MGKLLGKGRCAMRFAGFALLASVILFLGCGGGGTVQAPTEAVTLAHVAPGSPPVDYQADLSVTTGEGARTWVSTFDFAMTVDEVADDGSVKRRFDFSDFAITNYSGSTPEPDPDAGDYTGEFLVLTLDKEGNIVDWKGLDGIKGGVPSNPRFKNSIVYLMYRMFQPGPAQPVNAGSTWPQSFETTMRMAGNEVTFKGNVDNTVDGFGKKGDKDCVKIKSKINVSATGDRRVGEKDELSFEHEEEGKGEVWWSYADGIIAEYTYATSANQTFRRERAGKTDVATDHSGVDYEIKIKMK
jgi:hypothetical protein